MADTPELWGNWNIATLGGLDALGNPIQQRDLKFPKIPSWVGTVVDTINSVIDYLNTVLSIALAALQVAKAFAVGFLDPINAIIEAIIAEVEQFLEDLRKAGLYMTGDWYLAQPPFDDLLGGFAEYKLRMLARFTDTEDSTRPVLSERVPVFAMFVYASADFSALSTVLRFLSQMVGLLNFNLRSTKTLQTPVDVKVAYKSVDASIVGGMSGILDNFMRTLGNAITFSAAPAQVPDIAQVSWKLGSPPKSTGTSVFPAPPPAGFLIEVSTLREGLSVFYDRVLPNAAKVEGSAGEAQDREVGYVVTAEGTPLVLYGGADQIELDGIGYNASMESMGKVKDGSPRVFALRSTADTVPIPLELLKYEGKSLLQKTFFVSTADILGTLVSLVSPEYFQKCTYRESLPWNEMPYAAEFEIQPNGTVAPILESLKVPQTFYARVSSVSAAITKEDDFRYYIRDVAADDPSKPLIAGYSTVRAVDVPTLQSRVASAVENVSVETLKNLGYVLSGDVQLSRADRSELSETVELTYPSDSAKTYIPQLVTALAVLVLSRSDLEVGEAQTFRSGKAKTATGLESFARLIPDILVANPSVFFDLADEDVESSDLIPFRQSLLEGCKRVATTLYRKMGAQPEIEASLLTSAQRLLTFKWSESSNLENGLVPYEQTILGSLQDSITLGVARNPECAGLKVRRATLTRRVGGKVVVKAREPGFYTSVDSQNVLIRGSADRSPSLSLRSQTDMKSMQVYYIRSIIPPDVYAAAAQVLSIASASTLRPAADGAWLSVRFGQLFPEFDLLVDMILNWVRSMQLGAASLVDAILAYISFLESRILEMQSLLRRLDAIQNGMLKIQIPAVAALFLKGNGTADILQKFLSATSPPQDLETSYGGGAVLLAAGAPAFLQDMIVEMFSV
jgi:hypothetical protein